MIVINELTADYSLYRKNKIHEILHILFLVTDQQTLGTQWNMTHQWDM